MGRRSACRLSVPLILLIVLTTGVISAPRPATAVSQESLNPLGKAFVTMRAPDGVAVISTSSDAVLQSGLSLSEDPSIAAISPDGTTLYVSGASGTVYGFDTVTYNPTTSISLVGQDERGMAITPDGLKLYVADDHFQRV